MSSLACCVLASGTTTSLMAKNDILFSKPLGGNHWPVQGNHLFTLEATAYALLALVKAEEFEKAGPIVKWLNEQQKYRGGYGSTQVKHYAY